MYVHTFRNIDTVRVYASKSDKYYKELGKAGSNNSHEKKDTGMEAGN